MGSSDQRQHRENVLAGDAGAERCVFVGRTAVQLWREELDVEGCAEVQRDSYRLSHGREGSEKRVQSRRQVFGRS